MLYRGMAMNFAWAFALLDRLTILIKARIAAKAAGELAAGTEIIAAIDKDVADIKGLIK